MTAVRNIALPLLTVAAALAGWELLSSTGVFPAELPAVSAIGSWLGANGTGGDLWEAIGRTLGHWALALAIGIGVGGALGLAMGSLPVVDRLFSGVVEFFRPIPVVVYLPIMLLWLGARPQVVVILAAVAAIWPVLLQALYGMRAIDPVARDTARVFGLSRWQRLRLVELPSVVPYLSTGIRVASAITLLAAVSVELIGAVPGLGNTLSTYAANGVYDATYAVIAVIGVIGLALDAALVRIERRALRWHPSQRHA